MRYIKEYNHEFYYEINSSDFSNEEENRREFSQKEKDIISNSLGVKIIDYEPKDEINNLVEFNMEIIIRSKVDPEIKKIVDAAIDVYSFIDEWYFVKIYLPSNTFHSTMRIQCYKCDQMEGLLKLLKDIKI